MSLLPLHTWEIAGSFLMFPRPVSWIEASLAPIHPYEQFKKLKNQDLYRYKYKYCYLVEFRASMFLHFAGFHDFPYYQECMRLIFSTWNWGQGCSIFKILINAIFHQYWYSGENFSLLYCYWSWLKVEFRWVLLLFCGYWVIRQP